MMKAVPMKMTMEKTLTTTSQMMKVIPTETAMGTEMEMILETIMKRKKSQMMRVIPMKMTMEKTLTTTSQMMKGDSNEDDNGESTDDNESNDEGDSNEDDNGENTDENEE